MSSRWYQIYCCLQSIQKVSGRFMKLALIIVMYLPKIVFLLSGTQNRWSKNLSRLDLDSLSRQLKPKKELVSKFNSQMCCTIGFTVTIYDFLGKIPLRQLVYRVHNLPPSMRPLVYDFGQLQQQREADYTHRIVHNYVRSNPFKVSECCYSVH